MPRSRKKPSLSGPSPTHPNCIKCGRWKTATTPFMPMTCPSGKVKLMAVAEGPGSTEDAVGKQMVGPAGQVFTGLLARAEWDRPNEVAIQNAVRCGSSKPTMSQVRLCRPFLMQDVNAAKAPVIMAFGKWAGSALQDDAGCTVKRDRGRDLDISDLTYTPERKTLTYHPASILHGNEENRDYITDDLKMVRQLQPRMGTEAIQITSLKELDKIEVEFRHAKAFSIDLEWSTETGKLLCISVCKEVGKAYWWLIEHKESEWTWAEMAPRLASLLGAGTTEGLRPWRCAAKVGHNISGDAIQLAKHGIELAGDLIDTLVLVKMINELYPDKTLEHLSMRFANMPDYAKAMQPYKRGIKVVVGEKRVMLKKGVVVKQVYKKSKDYGNAPASILGPYCAGDGDAGWRLAKKYVPAAQKQKWWPLYQMYMKAERILARNTVEGWLVDVKVLDKKQKVLVREATTLKRDFLKAIVWKGKPFRFEGQGYEPHEEDLRRLLYRRLRLKCVAWTDTDKPSTSAKGLTQLWRDRKNARNELARKIVEMVIGNGKEGDDKKLGLRNYEKLIGTYLVKLRQRLVYRERCKHGKWVWPAGWYFCPGYTLAGAKTGRLSSRPNIQNIPPVIRVAFITRFK